MPYQPPDLRISNSLGAIAFMGLIIGLTLIVHASLREYAGVLRGLGGIGFIVGALLLARYTWKSL